VADLTAPDAGAGAAGPNASVPFGSGGSLDAAAAQASKGAPRPGGVPSGTPAGAAGPAAGGAPPTQPPPQMGVPQGSPVDMRNGPVTPGQVSANFTPPPARSLAWRDGLRALADGPHGGPALRALADHADRAQGRQ